MHSAAVYLAPILGAEKSKVPYYIAGGLLVAWALILSLGLGLRRSQFPGSAAGERAVIAISVVLVLATVATAVITSGTPAKAGATALSSTTASPASPSSTGATAPSAPAPSSTAATAPPSKGAPATALKLSANPSGLLSYNTQRLRAKAGTVSITMANMSPLEHNLTIAQGSTVLGATPTFVGGVRTLTLSLKPGTYTFYC